MQDTLQKVINSYNFFREIVQCSLQIQTYYNIARILAGIKINLAAESQITIEKISNLAGSPYAYYMQVRNFGTFNLAAMKADRQTAKCFGYIVIYMYAIIPAVLSVYL